MNELEKLKKQIILHNLNVSMPPKGFGYIPAIVIIIFGAILMVIGIRLK